tara:strand:+ start:136 stop:1074 length:939 start_codon:yes stop_codon:yes gene_type:complete
MRVTVILNKYLNWSVKNPIKIRFSLLVSKKRKIDKVIGVQEGPSPAVSVSQDSKSEVGPQALQAANDVFIPSCTYTGSKKGFVFTKGASGVGYYWDVVDVAAAEEVFELEASRELLALSSSYFQQILFFHKNGSALEMQEEHPKKAAEFVVFLHSTKEYPANKIDKVEAKLSAKWLLRSVTNEIKTNIDIAVAKMCGGSYNEGFRDFELPLDLLIQGWEGPMPSLDKSLFEKIAKIVSTHTAYQQGKNRFWHPIVNDEVIYSTTTLIALVNEHICSDHSPPVDLGLGLSAKDFHDFVTFSRKITDAKNASDY